MTPDNIPDLHLGWRNRCGPEEMHRVLCSYPGRSVWLPATREFGLVGPWRHRDEIAAVRELSASRNAAAVVEGLTERARDSGATVLLTMEIDETRRPAFYERAGLDLLETVITYELGTASTPPTKGPPLTFQRVSTSDKATVADVVALDHAAFPWLWWNSALEFQNYLTAPEVELWVGRVDGVVAAYIGVTIYHHWGHLDRIAVDPARQGNGLGVASLAFAVRLLAQRGARRVGLSTQGNNVRSQCLYERFGFQRVASNDYRLYGVWFR